MAEKNLLMILVLVLVGVVIGLAFGLVLGTGGAEATNSPMVEALDKIVIANPDSVMEHDEHFGLSLPNGDLVEFSKDTSLSAADVVVLINVVGIAEGIVDLESVPPCPPPDQELESGRFCYIPGEILAQEEPHLAEVYPEGVLLRPYDL